MENFTLVIHLNAFTGKLESGYLMSRISKQKVGRTMPPSGVLAYMSANPDVHCDPLKV